MVAPKTLKALISKGFIRVHIRNSLNGGHTHGFTRSNGWNLILYWFCQLDEYLVVVFVCIRSIASCISISAFSISNPNKVHLIVDTLKVKVRSFLSLSSESRSEEILGVSQFNLLSHFTDVGLPCGQAKPPGDWPQPRAHSLLPAASLVGGKLLSLYQEGEHSVTQACYSSRETQLQNVTEL